MKRLFEDIRPRNILITLLGSIILAFGVYNVHAFSGITEGGTIGLVLLLDHHFKISPAISSAVLNVICYAVGTAALGRRFVICSIAATAGFSLSYAVFEQFPPLGIFTAVHNIPLAAAVVGALFVGIGVGLCVRCGGAPTGDDALAMSLSKLIKVRIQWVYLITDLTVLGLSLTYIPLSKIVFSLISVVLSGQIIGLVDRAKLPGNKDKARDEDEKNKQ